MARDIHYVGMVHASQQSADAVTEAIAMIDPDTVCIDVSADQNLASEAYWAALRPADLLKGAPMAHLYQLAGFRASTLLAVDAAVAAAEGRRLVLVDRPSLITIQRMWSKAPLASRIRLIAALLSHEDIDSDDVEVLHDDEMLQEAIAAVPFMFQAVIDERARYIKRQLDLMPRRTIVAALSKAVAQRVQQLDGTNEARDEAADELSSAPTFWLPLAFRVGTAALGWATVAFTAPSGLGAVSWLVAVGAASSIAVLITGGHIITSLASAAMSPIAALLPWRKARLVVPLIEARIRPAHDEHGLAINAGLDRRAFRQSPLIRPLLIAAALGITLPLGAIAALLWTLLSAAGTTNEQAVHHRHLTAAAASHHLGVDAHAGGNGHHARGRQWHAHVAVRCIDDIRADELTVLGGE